MAKKAKRQSRKSSTVKPSLVEEKVASIFGKGSDRDFNPDYSLVIKDLKRIGTLAGIFFAVLIFLSFFLR